MAVGEATYRYNDVSYASKSALYRSNAASYRSNKAVVRDGGASYRFDSAPFVTTARRTGATGRR